MTTEDDFLAAFQCLLADFSDELEDWQMLVLVQAWGLCNLMSMTETARAEIGRRSALMACRMEREGTVH